MLSFTEKQKHVYESMCLNLLAVHCRLDDAPGGLPRRIHLLPQTTWLRPWRTTKKTTFLSPDHLITPLEDHHKDFLSLPRPSDDTPRDYLKDYLSFPRPPDDTPGGLSQGLPLLPQTTWWHPWRTTSRTTRRCGSYACRSAKVSSARVSWGPNMPWRRSWLSWTPIARPQLVSFFSSILEWTGTNKKPQKVDLMDHMGS